MHVYVCVCAYVCVCVWSKQPGNNKSLTKQAHNKFCEQRRQRAM